MKTNLSIARRPKTDATSRRQLLAQFKQSGLSATDFARKHGIGYSTFCAWRRRAAAKRGFGFAEVELVEAVPPPVGVTLELGRNTRIRVNCQEQVELAAALAKQWEAMC